MLAKILVFHLLFLHIYGLSASSRGPVALETSISYLAFDGSVENGTALVQPSGSNLHILGRKSKAASHTRP